MSSMKAKIGLPAILFPHCHLSEPRAKVILSLFEPITIFQPWFMEKSIFVSKSDGLNLIKTRNPPNHLKPKEGLKALLLEYRRWIGDNPDRHYLEFLKAVPGKISTESTVWEIREDLRRLGRNVPTSSGAHAVKWHLILYLAREMEEQRIEVEKLLKDLEAKDTPLKGVVEDQEQAGKILEDLPLFESEATGGYQLGRIFDAWFALFGGYLKGHELLVTYDHHVMDYACGLFEGLGVEDGECGESNMGLRFPDLSHLSLERLSRIKREHFDGKTSLEEVLASFPWELSGGALRVSLKSFPPTKNSEHVKKDAVIGHLSQKTIILVEKESS